jgi:Type III secretion system lipoprotein chaperone (YscW)
MRKIDSGPSCLVIKGQLTYRERIALPPKAVAVVELRDASTPEGPVIAGRCIELEGRQVPVPFELRVERAKLVAGEQYTLRGTFFDGGRPIQRLGTSGGGGYSGADRSRDGVALSVTSGSNGSELMEQG